MSRWEPRPVLEPEASICAVVCPASWLFASSIVQVFSLSEGLGLCPGSYLFLCLIRALTSSLNLICPLCETWDLLPFLPSDGWASSSSWMGCPD